MIGIVIVAHGPLAEALAQTAALIVGGAPPAVATVAVTGLEQPDRLKDQIQAAVKQVNQGFGVVLFTDMFGGTPSNIALSFLKENEVEVVSGVNLPMLVDILYTRTGKTLAEFCRATVDAGRSSIQLAGEYLQK
jgi:PTS system mannose-specific IIA component